MSKHHLHVAVASSEENEDKQQDLIETFVSQNVSAIILVPVKSKFQMKREWLKIPIMTLDRELESTSLPSITVDNEEALYCNKTCLKVHVKSGLLLES